MSTKASPLRSKDKVKINLKVYHCYEIVKKRVSVIERVCVCERDRERETDCIRKGRFKSLHTQYSTVQYRALQYLQRQRGMKLEHQSSPCSLKIKSK